MEFANSTIFAEETIFVEGHRSLLTRILGGLVMSYSAMASIFGNSVVITCYLTDDNIRSQPGNAIITFLAMVDAMTGLFLTIPTITVLIADDWILGEAMCKFSSLCLYTFGSGSKHIITLISLDRLIALRDPFLYQAKATSKLLFTITTVLFLYCLVFGIACSAPYWSQFYYREAICSMNYYTRTFEFSLLLIYSGVIMQVPPLVVTVVANILIAKMALKNRNSVQAVFVRRQTSINANQNRLELLRTVKTSVILVGALWGCFVPYETATAMQIHLGTKVPLWLNMIIFSIFYLSSSVNPFIYAIFRRDYNIAIKKVLGKIRETILCRN